MNTKNDSVYTFKIINDADYYDFCDTVIMSSGASCFPSGSSFMNSSHPVLVLPDMDIIVCEYCKTKFFCLSSNVNKSLIPLVCSQCGAKLIHT